MKTKLLISLSGILSFCMLATELCNGNDGYGRGVERNKIRLRKQQNYNHKIFLDKKWWSENPVMAVGNFLSLQRIELGLEINDIKDFVVGSSYTNEHNKVQHYYCRQKVNGIKIADAYLNLHVGAQKEIVSVHCSFVSDAQNKINVRNPEITDLEAVDAVEKMLDHGNGLAKTSISTDLAYLPSDAETLRLTWHFILELLDTRYVYEAYVDAVSGEILVLRNKVLNESYHVYPFPTQDPVTGGRELRLNPYSFSPSSASPYGWHDTDGQAGAEYTITRGNNVHTYEDSGRNNASQGNEPDGGLDLIFDFPIDLSQHPHTYSDASIVNLFYWNNFLHDVFYGYGFNEAAGNFQANNYGKGGIENDYMRAEGQDGLGFNNGNMYTPPDGQLPRMQIFLGNRITPYRDGSLDNQVIIHEYGHGVSHRLAGGPDTTSCLEAFQSRGLGEGWSDWWGLVFTTSTNDNRNTPRPYSTWLFGMDPDGRGIRPYSYSTDMTIDPHTYGDLSTGMLTIPHGIGSVWCVTLWDLYWDLIDVHGYDSNVYNGTGGNNIALQLVMDGLKLQPCNPSFLDARDAILLADVLNNNGENQELIWKSFARRGMGYSADDGGSADVLSVTEAFDVPDSLDVSPKYGFNSFGLEGGPYSPSCQSYELSNQSAEPVNWIAHYSASWFNVVPSNGTLNPGETSVVEICISDFALTAGNYSDTLSFSNVLSQRMHEREIKLRVGAIATLPYYENFESGTLGFFWNVSGTGEYRSKASFLNIPHQGRYHLVMDDYLFASQYSRNEVTLNINLKDWQDVRMRFWAKGLRDEGDGPPSIPFLNGADFDGVAISEDGVYWYELQELRTSISSTYQEYEVDLDAAIALYGLEYNDRFKIRFNQYGSLPAPNDGIAIDDISIEGEMKREIQLMIPAQALEGAGVLTNAGLLTVTPTFSSNQTIVLSSDDPSEITTPSTVLFAPGETSKIFDITVVNDAILDGSQIVVISASATNWNTGSNTIRVLDNEVSYFSISTIDPVQHYGVPFPASITAHDMDGNIISNYNGSDSISAQGDSGSISTTPSAADFTNGLFQAMIYIQSMDENVTMKIDNGLGVTSTSDLFDIVPIKIPTPLQPIKPLGTLAYTTNLQASLPVGVAEQAYWIMLDKNQYISLLIQPEAFFQPEISVMDESLVTLTNRAADAEGLPLLVQNLPITTAGAYIFRLNSQNNTYGNYSLKIYLNALLEEETFFGYVSNNTFQAAQSLDNGFTYLGDGSVSRNTIVGELDSSTSPDWISFFLESGISATFLLEAKNRDGFQLDIFDRDGETLLKSGIENSETAQIIETYIPPISGKYFALISNGNAEYYLTLIKNAVFDFGTNSSFVAVSLSNETSNILGQIKNGFYPNEYSYEIMYGDAVEVKTFTPGDGPYEPVNILNPLIELYDPHGALLEKGLDINTLLWETGKHTIRIYQTNSTVGTYLMQYKMSADLDKDLLPNAWEFQYFSDVTNALSSLDSDGDGHSNYHEYIAGTDPLNDMQYFYIELDPQRKDQVIIPLTMLERKYAIEHSTNILNPEWIKIFTNLNGNGLSILLTNETTNATDFYRGIVELP